MRKRQPVYVPLENEELREIAGFSGYFVSNIGRVISFRRYRTGRMCLGGVDKDGYRHVCITRDDGEVMTPKVAVLVARAFIGCRPDGMEVAHNDGDESNDRLDNLSYKTPIENIADKRKHGTHFEGERCHNAKLTPQQVAEIFLSPEGPVALSKRFPVRPNNITEIQRGRSWRHITAALHT